MALRANIAYLVGEIATKFIQPVQVKQKRAAVSQKAVEVKQLSPRLAGETQYYCLSACSKEIC